MVVCKMGSVDRLKTGRREIFLIDEGERLIGFEADICQHGNLWGLTFIKLLL